MWGFRPRARVLGLAAACAAPVVDAWWIRPRLLTWGATHDEAASAYPGDELVRSPAHSPTMATTLPAPPEWVWPWLARWDTTVEAGTAGTGWTTAGCLVPTVLCPSGKIWPRGSD
jgi:hypothetical protein